MPMVFEELDPRTSTFTVAEFDSEQSGPNPYRSRNLTSAAQVAAVSAIRYALESGAEQTLTRALSDYPKAGEVT